MTHIDEKTALVHAGLAALIEDLLEQRRPAARGLAGRESWRGDDLGRHRRRRLRHAPHAARTVGVPGPATMTQPDLQRTDHYSIFLNLDQLS